MTLTWAVPHNASELTVLLRFTMFTAIRLPFCCSGVWLPFWCPKIRSDVRQRGLFCCLQLIEGDRMNVERPANMYAIEDGHCNANDFVYVQNTISWIIIYTKSMCDAIKTYFTISRPQTQSYAVQHTYRRVPLVTSTGSIISNLLSVSQPSMCFYCQKTE